MKEPVPCHHGYCAILARAKVDMGASGEVHSPQAMSRLSSSTMQPTSAASMPGRFHVIQVLLRRAVLRPICGERQQYFLQDLGVFLCTFLCLPFPAPGILPDGSLKTKISFVGQE